MEVVSLTARPPFTTPERFLVLISVTGRVDPRAVGRLDGLSQLKNPMISFGIEPATLQLVPQCLNQLRYHVLSIKVR
jgi:hypothetical protein